MRIPNTIPSALAIAAISTTAGIFLLAFTEEFSPAGSPVAWLIILLIAVGHYPLLTAKGRSSSSSSSNEAPTAEGGCPTNTKGESAPKESSSTSTSTSSSTEEDHASTNQQLVGRAPSPVAGLQVTQTQKTLEGEGEGEGEGDDKLVGRAPSPVEDPAIPPTEKTQDDEEEEDEEEENQFVGPAPSPVIRPRQTLLPLAAAALITAAALILCYQHLHRIFDVPVIPRKSAQLGLVTQVASRLGSPHFLYLEPYQRDGYMELNNYTVPLVMPYALARAWALDWRFASYGAVALMAGLLAAGAIMLARARQPNLFALAGLAIGGAGWLLSFRTADFLQWGPTAPLWPLIAALGLCVALRWWLMGAIAAGLLAAMNAGWVLMLPVVGALLWSESRKRGENPWPLLVALFVLPVLTYGPFRGEWESMGSGILGSIFNGAEGQQQAGSHRFPSLHGLGDFLGLRWAIYLAGLVGVGYCAARIAKASSLSDRLRWVALAGFLLVACAPTVWFFHWYAHAVLLAALIPAAALASEENNATGVQPLLGFLAPPILAALMAFIIVRAGVPDAINHLPEGRQSHVKHLAAGWNVESQDHVWGRETYMAVGFKLDRVEPGLLELHLGTLGGDFTPFNPVIIRVNGRIAGLWRELPGEYGYARVPLLETGDVHVGYNIVELETRWARTPESLNIADDQRRLSIAYLGMRWLPVDQLPPNAIPRAARPMPPMR